MVSFFSKPICCLAGVQVTFILLWLRDLWIRAETCAPPIILLQLSVQVVSVPLGCLPFSPCVTQGLSPQLTLFHCHSPHSFHSDCSLPFIGCFFPPVFLFLLFLNVVMFDKWCLAASITQTQCNWYPSGILKPFTPQ